MGTIRTIMIWSFAALLGGVAAVNSQVRHVGGTQEARLSGHCLSIVGLETSPLSLGDVRVRRGGQASVTGMRQAIYVDNGGQADVKATAAMIYVAKGGEATVSGQRNHVYAEQGGKVVLVGQVSMTVVDTLELQVHRNAVSCQ